MAQPDLTMIENRTPNERYYRAVTLPDDLQKLDSEARAKLFSDGCKLQRAPAIRPEDADKTMPWQVTLHVGSALDDNDDARGAGHLQPLQYMPRAVVDLYREQSRVFANDVASNTIRVLRAG